MSTEVGTRVVAISHTEKNTIYIFGYGTYMGYKKPKDFEQDHQPTGVLGYWLIEEDRENPCIQLDNGQYIWGCECWWGPVEKAEETIKDYKVEELDIQEKRKELNREVN